MCIIFISLIPKPFHFLHVKADLDSRVRERAKARNGIIDGYLRVLPSVQRKLAFRNQSAVPKFSQIRRQCESFCCALECCGLSQCLLIP